MPATIYIVIGIAGNLEMTKYIGLHSNIDGPTDCHSRWSESDREGQILYYITYICNLKNVTNNLVYKKKKTYRCTEQLYNKVIRRVKGKG